MSKNNIPPQIKCDTEENWQKARNYIPPSGTIIIYDGILKEGKYIKMPRLKLGDGITLVKDLPFFELQPDTVQFKARTEESVLILD